MNEQLPQDGLETPDYSGVGKKKRPYKISSDEYGEFIDLDKTEYQRIDNEEGNIEELEEGESKSVDDRISTLREDIAKLVAEQASGNQMQAAFTEAELNNKRRELQQLEDSERALGTEVGDFVAKKLHEKESVTESGSLQVPREADLEVAAPESPEDSPNSPLLTHDPLGSVPPLYPPRTNEDELVITAGEKQRIEADIQRSRPEDEMGWELMRQERRINNEISQLEAEIQLKKDHGAHDEDEEIIKRRIAIAKHRRLLEDIHNPQEEPKQPETPEEIKAEYLRLKQEFKQQRKEYFDALKSDYEKRGDIKKAFGIGRKKLSFETQALHDRFMHADKQYLQFAKEHGFYDKIEARLNRDNTAEEEVSVAPSVVKRHATSHVQERLDLQKRELPPKLGQIMERVTSLYKNTSYEAKVTKFISIGALGLKAQSIISSLGVGLLTSLAINKGGGAIIAHREKKYKERVGSLNDMVMNSADLDLDKLEEDLFQNLRSIDNNKLQVKAAAVVGGMAAGMEAHDWLYGTPDTPDVSQPHIEGVSPDPVTAQAYGEMPGSPVVDGEIKIDGTSEASPLDEAREILDSVEEAAGAQPEKVAIEVDESVEARAGTEASSQLSETIERTFTPERGETLTRALQDGLRARLEAGEIHLPPGVTEETLSSYVYRTFPEMTNAAHVEPTLSHQDWVDLGVKSGNPHNIAVGEEIDLQGLIDKMPGLQGEAAAPAAGEASFAEVSTPESAAADVPAAEPAPRPEAVSPHIVMDKVYLSPNGEMQFLTPDGVAPGSATEVVSPFTNETPYVKAPGEELIDAMMKRIEADVHSGIITLDQDLDLGELKQKLLAKYPELQKPDMEEFWFQRPAKPGLPDAFWKEIGVPGGDPLNIPNNAEINMSRLLNEVFGFHPSGDEFSVYGTDSHVPVSEAASVEVASTSPAAEVRTVSAEIPPSGTEQAAIAATERAQVAAAAAAERMATIPEALQGYTTEGWPPPGYRGDLQQFVADTMLRAYQDGQIHFTPEIARNVANRPEWLMGFIEKNAPELSDNLLSKLMGGNTGDILPPELWQKWGISSGDPLKLAATDHIKVGEIIKYLLTKGETYEPWFKA